MPLINLFVTSPDTHSERRLDSSLTIDQLKDKLTPITGIQPQHQTLKLYRSSEGNEGPLATLSDGSRTLADYGLQEWNVIKIDSTDPNARPGEFTDLSAVDKFELTSEEYEARQDTVLSHLKANKLGRFAPTPTNLTQPPPPPSIPSTVIPGARCEVSTGGSLKKRGTVRYVGETTFGRGGVWVGVELDEPMGKGDGSVDGKRYFTCRALHAVFVRGDKVVVGDFPEEDLMDDEDEI